ncbi:MAG TPA: PKD domain-containing protein [Anaerolineae bacterium]|nr:PKD domain-containing protein [Anaerolineae bacterium]
MRAGRLVTDLRITMTMMPTEELTLPAQITYALSYVAAGGPAAGVVITDILPASLDNVEVASSGPAMVDTGVRPGYVWQVGDLAAGERGVITITAQANATRFVNTAEIGSTSRDVNLRNNVATVQTHVAGILYVDADAWGANDGSTWVDAYTDLQDALAAAKPGDEIWVADGVYKPTTGVNRAASFALASGVAIYGGFAGNEAYVSERDWRARPTVLDGDIGTVNNAADNAYHLVTASGVDATAVLDGFIITGGRATGEDASGRGGGIYIDDASPTLRYLALLGNSAEQGGGLYSAGTSSPVLANVVLSGDAATTGGGLYNEAGSLALINVTLSENSATTGGALYNGGVATLTNCIVWDEDPAQSLIAGDGTTTIAASDVRGGAAGTGNLDADPQFVSARGADGVAGTLDDDLRLHTTFSAPSPVIDQGQNSALPADADDLDGDGNVSEPLPFDMSSRARLIGFTALPPAVDMGALEANIEDVLAEGDTMLAEGTSFRMQRLQLLPSDTPELALQNYSNFGDGEWYYAFCSDYDNVDADGYCPVTGPDHVRNDLLDTVDVYRVAVSVWPTETWTTRSGDLIEVWQRGGQGVLGATVEIGNDHLIFGNEYLVDATDYRFSTGGLPYADQIIGQELDELARAARQFELVMDLIFRAFSDWRVGDYCSSDQFETFGVTSSLLMSALDEMASRHYMMGQTDLAREVYLEASRNQNMHLTGLAELAKETGHNYLVNGSWEMLNNVSRMRERARQIESGFDFFGFRPDYAPLQPYEQLLELTEGPGGVSGLLGTARDLEDQARDAQRTYDTNASSMATELDMWKYELDDQLFDLCGPTEDLDGDGYGDYRTCKGGLMAQNWANFQSAYVRRALAWMRAQNIALEIQTEQERSDQVIMVALAAGREIAAADLAIGKLEAEKTTTTTATSTESEFHTDWGLSAEAWVELGFKLSTQVANTEAYASGAIKTTLSAGIGGEDKTGQVDTTQTEWDPNAEAIAAYESIKDLKQAEAQAAIEGAASAATIKNLLLEQSEALQEWEVATAELNQVVVEHNNMLEKWSRLVNLYTEAVPTVMTYNSHLLNPAYRLWRDSLTVQASRAHSLAAQFAYLTARASEYELLTPFPNLGDALKTRTANDIRTFLDDLKVWHQALDLPGQLNRYPYTLSVAQDLFSLTDEELDPGVVLTPEELAEERYKRLQEAFARRIDNGDLEIVFSTSLDQQRPGGHFVFSPNIWNNRIAGIGEPLASDVGVKVNIITTQPVDAGMVEVVLVHDGQATYRNASAQDVIYDPATAVPVGYLIPAELSPAQTTVVLRPDVNGVGGLPNSGLVNLSVAASHWKLRIPATSWGNLDVSQIKDIEIFLDTTGRSLPSRTVEAADDAARLEAGLEMALPSQEWLQELDAKQQDALDLNTEHAAPTEQLISALAIPGEVSGSYYGNLVVTSPITIAVQELNFDLMNVEGALAGVVGVTDSSLAAEPIPLAGTATGDQFVLASEPFTNVVNGRVVTQIFTLAGHAEEDAEILRAVYTGTITNLLPSPITVQGLFVASRPGAMAGNGLVVEAGTWELPVDASTPVTVTLINGLMQPISGTGTVTFTTDVGTVVPSTVDMVDGVAVATFQAGSAPGDTGVVAAMDDMTGRVRIQIVASGTPIADAGPDQEVDPGDTVRLDGSASSDPNGDPLVYRWVQTGGPVVDFAPAVSVTTFVAPSGLFTFTLIVTNTAGLSGTDTTVIEAKMRIYLPLLMRGGPQARSAPDQVVASALAGSDIVPADINSRGVHPRRPTRPWRST